MYLFFLGEGRVIVVGRTCVFVFLWRRVCGLVNRHLAHCCLFSCGEGYQAGELALGSLLLGGQVYLILCRERSASQCILGADKLTQILRHPANDYYTNA